MTIVLAPWTALHAAAVALLGAYFAFPATAIAQPLETDRSWLDINAVERGEVALRVLKDGRLSVLDAAILIDAPAEKIWDVLTACDVAPEYVPKLVACSSIELLDDGAAEMFNQTVKPAFFLPSFEHVFRMDYERYSRIDIHRVDGPIDLLDAAWLFEPQADGRILLIYELTLDPGIPVPRAFVRATLRRDMPVVLMAIRERAEAAGRAESETAD